MGEKNSRRLTRISADMTIFYLRKSAFIRGLGSLSLWLVLRHAGVDVVRPGGDAAGQVDQLTGEA